METRKCIFRREEQFGFCDSKGTGMLQKIWFQNNQAIVQGIGLSSEYLGAGVFPLSPIYGVPTCL